MIHPVLVFSFDIPNHREMYISKISAHNALFATCIQVYVTYLDVFMETIAAIPPTGIHCDSFHKEGPHL